MSTTSTPFRKENIESPEEVALQLRGIGLLQRERARPSQFEYCNRCNYAFARTWQGLIDLRGLRRHKRECLPTAAEMCAWTPLPEHVKQRFPHLEQQRKELAERAIEPKVYEEDDSPFSRKASYDVPVEVANEIKSFKVRVATRTEDKYGKDARNDFWSIY